MDITNLIPIGSFGYGGYFAGIFEDNIIILSPEKYQKELDWYDGYKYCQHLKINNYDEWDLAAIDELKTITNNILKLKNIFGLNYSEFHWSKTEVSKETAWYYYLSSGIANGTSLKDTIYFIRPIRRINISEFKTSL